MWSDKGSNAFFTASASALLSNGEKKGERNAKDAAMTNVGPMQRKMEPYLGEERRGEERGESREERAEKWH